MSTKIFKTTLVRSNPQVVRQFQISDSRPIRDLLICVCLMHGWEVLNDMEIITADNLPVILMESIEKTLNPVRIGQYWYIKCPVRNSLGDVTEEFWTFRLDYLGTNHLGEISKIGDPLEVSGNADSSENTWNNSNVDSSENTRNNETSEHSGNADFCENTWNNANTGAGENTWNNVNTGSGENAMHPENPELIGAKTADQERSTPAKVLPEQVDDSASLRDTCGISQDLEPWLLRIRGQNPVYFCQDMTNWNALHQEMLANGECYTYRTGYILAEKYMPDIDKINMALERRIVRGIIDVKIDYSRGEDLSNILNTYSLLDLKQMVKEKRLNFSNSPRKYEFLHDLEKFFNQDKAWATIVDAMNLAEYENFRGICLGTCSDNHPDMPLLNEYCLIREMPSYDKDLIPKELIAYFEKIAGEGSEAALYKEKRIRMVLEACRKLYIVFSKTQAKYIAEIMFPDELTDNDVEKAWGNRRHFLLLNPEVMYSTVNLEEAKAEELYNYLEEEKIPYYTPEKDELFEIVQKGFRFSESIQEKMIEAIRRVQLGLYQTFYNQEEIASFIYELYHLGWGRAAIEVQLRKKYNIGNSRKDMDNLFRIADASSNDIRMVSLRSNTRREYNRLMSFRKREAARRKKESEL